MQHARMGGGMEKTIAMLKAHSESAKRRASLYGQVAKMADGGAVKEVTALQHSTNAGKHMQKVGFIMMWIPEPTGLTCAVGGPMILAGRYLDKKCGGSLSDVTAGAKGALEGVSNVRNSML